MISSINKGLGNDSSRGPFIPHELIPYFNGKKIKNEDEGLKVRQLMKIWAVRVAQAVNSGNISLLGALEEIPNEGYRKNVIKAITRLVRDGSEGS